MENNEDQSFENELRKAKLIAEKGAFFSGSSNLPTEIEKNFLDYIEQFEQQFEKRERIPVYDFIGRPEYRKDVPDAEISEELEKLLEFMGENQVSLSHLAEVSDKELYRFIIEELFEYEMDNVKIEGMMHCFTYEDFHPNHVYDIQRHTTELIDILFKGKPNGIKYMSHSFKAISGKEVTEDQLIYIFDCFQKCYKNLKVTKLELLELQIGEEYASQSIYIDWEGKPLNSETVDKFSGNGTIRFIHDFDYWYVCGINIPGMEV